MKHQQALKKRRTGRGYRAGPLHGSLRREQHQKQFPSDEAGNPSTRPRAPLGLSRTEHHQLLVIPQPHSSLLRATGREEQDNEQQPRLLQRLVREQLCLRFTDINPDPSRWPREPPVFSHQRAPG